MDTEIEVDTSGLAPVACTLTKEEAARQALEWVDLQQRAITVTAINGGAQMTFPASLAAEVQDLVRREAGCCTFLTIESSLADEVLTIDISSINPDALPLISALSGISIL